MATGAYLSLPKAVLSLDIHLVATQTFNIDKSRSSFLLGAS